MVRRVVLVVVSVLLTCNIIAGERKATGPALKSKGVVAYDIQSVKPLRFGLVKAGHEAEDLHDTLTLSASNGGKDTSAVYELLSGDVVRLSWSLASGELRISSGAESVLVRFDTNAKQWVTVGSTKLYERTKDDVSLIGLAMVEMKENHMITNTSDAPQSESMSVDPDHGAELSPAKKPREAHAPSADLRSDLIYYIDPIPEGGGFPGANCGGAEVRGSKFGDTRSYACRAATDDANYQCWNRKCAGCCFLYDCDATCAVGDLFCVAGRSGKSCTL